MREGDHYRIHGTKIFITYGEHDLTDNIDPHGARAHAGRAGRHARHLAVPGPEVPGQRRTARSAQRNDLRCVSLEHKLGIHASPTCVMAFGDDEGAIGYLVGEEQGGMAAMFTMMNNARLSVGLEGLAIAERAYQAALAYARERVQGRAQERRRRPPGRDHRASRRAPHAARR